MGLRQSAVVRERPGPVELTIGRPSHHFATLIGDSALFRDAIALADRVAAYPDANVLLVGETGTGKELFARAIHEASPNAGDPFVAINCSAIPETLLESELFGHEKGAFTDARSLKRGLLEVAGRGTVMLDEINELPLNLQPKLLRVLEDRRVRRLGALREYDVTCRVIAATNVDPAISVEKGTFRSDLFYRLNVLRIEIPALRERTEDIDLLADYFVRTICHGHGLPPKRLSPEARVVLRSHPWLGNVRELKNTLESAIVMCDSETVRPEHIRLRKRASIPVPGDVILTADPGTPATSPGMAELMRVPPGGITLAQMERSLIQETLRQANGNRSLAARMLGISRPTVVRKIEQYGLG